MRYVKVAYKSVTLLPCTPGEGPAWLLSLCALYASRVKLCTSPPFSRSFITAL